MKSGLNSILGALGYEYCKIQYRPFGLNHSHDIVRFLGPEERVQVVFDVGANEGQSVMEYVKWFPEAEIYSFEPIRATYEKLVENCHLFRNVHTYELAFGAARGTVEVELAELSVQNSLRRRADGIGKGRVENVTVETLDRFVASLNIQKIDLLKTDTEGYDLDVLKGAEGLLSSGVVRFVLAEVTFNPNDGEHTFFVDVFEFLTRHGFGFVDIYDHDYVSFNPRKPPLGYCNALFYRT